MEQMDQSYAALGASQGQQAGYYNAFAQGQAKRSPLETLYEALKNVGSAASQARGAADQLCGSQPETVGKDAAPQAASFFGQIGDIAEELNTYANRIMTDMQRIQSRL